jgi:Icc-related predicted phosphoesterase
MEAAIYSPLGGLAFCAFTAVTGESRVRLFFTTDIHGSEKCFLKFVNAAAFYRADVIVLGGDMTGKAMVPVVQMRSGEYTCELFGRPHSASTDEELRNLEKLIRANGFYPFRSDEEEVEHLSTDDSLRERKFLELMMESIERWVEIAQDRLRGTGTACFMSPGNDDHLAIDDVLAKSDFVINPEGRVVDLVDGKGLIEMISCGWSSPTPFDTPRECSEEELGDRLDEMASHLRDPERAIFNLHNPPFGTKLDLAPALTDSLQVKSEGGQAKLIPVGSTSVRRAIETYQPQLGLHGHIHESRARVKLRRTVCVNPGSEYSEGILHGVLVDFKGSALKSVQLVSG